MTINATIVGQLISFGFFVFFCMKFIWPVFTEAMIAREKKIADGLSAAGRAEADLAEAQLKIEAELIMAKTQAAGIIEQANKRASQMVEEARDNAKDEAEKVKLSAKAEIEQEANSAREALRADVSRLSIAGAEKILASTVDQKVHSQMLETLAAEL